MASLLAKKRARGECRACKNPLSEDSVRFCDEHVRRHKEWWLDNQYGVSTDLVQAMLIKQGGVCAICKAKPTHRDLDLDHNHGTNVARGLLCTGCNTGLGNLKDNPEIILRAAQYVLSSGFQK
jgi:hypothetical protein